MSSGGSSKPGVASFALGLCVAVFFAVPAAGIGYWGWRPVHAWKLGLGAGVAVLWLIGRVAGQHLLVDERGRWSLSRLQLLAWTLLLLPTIWVMVVVRMLAGATDALALGIDENLWALLGISAASSVGSPLILDRKRATGTLEVGRAVSPSVSDGVSDLFRGEETGNADVVDIARVQMCLLTAVTVVVYSVACWRAFASSAGAALEFPAMSENLVVLIGISHATYLAAKVPTHAPLRRA